MADAKIENPSETPQSKRRSFFLPPPSSAIWILATILTVALLYVLRDLVLIVLLAVFLAYLINPIVKIAESRVFRREPAVNTVYLGIVVIVFVASYFLLPVLRGEVEAISNGWPSFTARLDDAIDAVQDEIAVQYPSARGMLASREVRYQKLDALIEQQMTDLPALSGRLAAWIFAGLLIPFFSYFFLRDGRKIIQFFIDRLAAHQIETSVAVWCEINRIVGNYLRGLALNSILLGTLAATGLWLLGVNYPILLGVLTGLANVVPYVGPIIGAVATAVVTLVQYKSVAPLAKVLTFYLGLKLINFLVIQPNTMRGGKELHPVLFIASIIVGGHLLGIIGMIIAVPIFTIGQESAGLLLERRRSHVPRPIPDDSPKTAPGQVYVC
jgi:predicted PurR-regulated permease PerM